MEHLVMYGFATVIGLIIGAILSIIGLFFGNIIVFDSLALAIASGFLANGLLNIHPALSVLIGLAVLAAMYLLQRTKVGFWIIGGLLSVFWGLVFSLMAWEFSGKDMVWTYVVLGLGIILMMGLHIHARRRNASGEAVG